MSHMTCVNHKQAQQVCINPQCKCGCAYLCIEPKQKCRIDHQACSLASIPYLLRKANKITARAHDFHIEKLINFHQSARKIMDSIQCFLEDYHLLSGIKQVLDPHGLLDPKDKRTITQFLHSKARHQTDVSLGTLQRELSALSLDLSGYLQLIRSARERHDQIKSRRESGIKSGIRSKVVKPSPVKSAIKEIPLDSKIASSQLVSKLKEGELSSEPPSPRQQKTSKIKERSRSKVLKMSEKQIQQPPKLLARGIKEQVQKPPFFSKITNDVQTINSLFYHKFKDVKLLYRASQNQFLASKFHEKCDGIENTLTIVLTQYDKVVGGFTPLPWRSDGDWYEDKEGTTFLFSLSSGERYPLINKDRAIWCSHAFGPSFGHPDLEISDRAFLNSNSNANFPQCFNNGNYKYGAGTTQLFCGSKSGHFKIQEWQVYQLLF